MKNDRQLLELSAFAAGLLFDPNVRDKRGLHVVAPGARRQSDTLLWNPLVDDGDALRLAVKLRIKFRYNEARGQCIAWIGGASDFEARANIEDCKRDETACARRAIVLASAELAKARVA